jgi:flavin reductase (DIM6/NTAB) family NADH-FMN oxidoreductase RutF
MEHPNLIAVAWIGMMGSNPPIVGVSFHVKRFSLENIRRTKEFTVNIPNETQFKKVDYCGLVSGQKRAKFSDCDFAAIPAFVVNVPLVAECPFNLECRVVQEIVFGDWAAVFGEIVETHVDEDKVDPETNKIDISKVRPLVYCATIQEYWTMGSRLGFGFNAGKELQNDKRKSDPMPNIEIDA